MKRVLEKSDWMGKKVKVTPFKGRKFVPLKAQRKETLE